MTDKYILTNCNTFEPKDIFDCGQCFRWNKELDGSYTGVFNHNVVNVYKNKNKIIFSGVCEGNLEKICREYFDLDRDYEKMKEQLSAADEFLSKSIEYGKGIRILNQDLWETIISFIISANNNISRIKGIIERLSIKYGDEVVYNKKKYYTFPSINQLHEAAVEDLKDIGLGFRDKRVYDTTQIIYKDKNFLKSLQNEKDTEVLENKLLQLPGVGPKVANCIMLFSTLKRFEVFPIDVWVRRVMNDIYFKNEDENSLNKNQIKEFAERKYGNLAGIAQQYLFYWRRGA